MMDEYVYRWADGTWCYREDLESYLTFMSDDYEAFTVDEFFKKYPEEI